MNSIELMKKEIEEQFKALKIKKSKKTKNFHDYLFVGSGDSFVSGLIASYESNFNCLCVDPVEIIINPFLCNKKRVCFISISGKTKENVLAAKIAKTKDDYSRYIRFYFNYHDSIIFNKENKKSYKD